MMISPEQLRRFSLFAGLDPGIFKELAMISEDVAFGEGEWLFHEGNEAEAMFLVLSGAVDLKISLDKEGNRHADLATLVEGEMVGCSALVEPYTYGLGCVANSDVRLVKTDAEALRELMAHKPEQGLVLMSHVAQVIRARLTNLRVRFVSITDMN
jgi:CRP-like cAMP-binding protein